MTHFPADGTQVKARASVKCSQHKESAAPPDDDEPGVASNPPINEAAAKIQPDRNPAHAENHTPEPKRRS